MFRAITTFILVTLCWPAFSQSLSPQLAEHLFNKKYYGAVWKFYQQELKKDSLNADLNYRMGICYLNSRSQKEKSISYLKKAYTISHINSVQQARSLKLLGDASYITEDFDKALGYYENYQRLSVQNPGFALQDVSREIEMCKMAKELKELKTITQNLVNQKSVAKRTKSSQGLDKIGYSVSNTSPVFTKNGITLKDRTDSEYFEEISESVSERTLSVSTDTSKTKMETTVASSTDGQIILIYRNDDGEANLYTSVLTGNNWASPQIVNKIVNNSFWEPDEFVSADGKWLYFASNRDGGFGGKDIYRCEKLKNGEWGKAVNLGASVNSMFDEEAPFIFPDGKTLHFSSNRNRPKGGFDNFTCTFSDSLYWTKPANVGYPLNEHGATEIQSDTSSVRANYLATFNNVKNVPINIMKGRIIAGGDIPSDLEITITDNETGQVAGVYKPDLKTGQYTCIIPSWKNINVSFIAKGYLPVSENVTHHNESGYYQLQRPVVIKQISGGQTTTLKNIFFDEGKSTIKPTSQIELNRLYSFLKEHPKLSVEISSSLPKKSSSENVKLAEERLQSIINFLAEHGINSADIDDKVYKYKRKEKEKVDEITTVNPLIALKVIDKKKKR